jgi:formylglycine-generating enzyme required for sulfatase activity
MSAILSKSTALAALGLLAISATPAYANGLRIETGVLERVPATTTAHVTAKVSWHNSWRTDLNHDAVWVFAKLRPRPNAWRHAALVNIEAVRPSAPVSCAISADRVGAFCSPSGMHRGPLTFEIVLTLDLTRLPERDRSAANMGATVFGTEMVHVPDGAFSVGNPDARSVEYSALYKSNAAGTHDGPFRITSEASLRIAPEAGALYYVPKDRTYDGDQGGPLPSQFPKGTRAFYIMKYELLQGQYADFLNTIGPEYAFFRAIHAGPGYYAERGTIRLDGSRYVADRPDRPANWVSWDDGIAYADWAGLRPMTELEFAKASRGPGEPSGIDYAWGTSSKARLLRRVGPDGDLMQQGEADESRLTVENREVFGASYYWVMDLAGSVWEKVVSIGHPKGRAFRGTHGDGELRAYGVATNEDWPSGDHDGGGYGYRGGGNYEYARDQSRPDTPLSLNPHSPVDWRSYAAWGGAPRSVGYGFRAVRTADPAR